MWNSRILVLAGCLTLTMATSALGYQQPFQTLSGESAVPWLTRTSALERGDALLEPDFLRGSHVTTFKVDYPFGTRGMSLYGESTGRVDEWERRHHGDSYVGPAAALGLSLRIRF